MAGILGQAPQGSILGGSTPSTILGGRPSFATMYPGVAQGGQSISAYEPTWRDRAAMFMQDTLGVPRHTTAGLLGSTGLGIGAGPGPGGTGLADLTTIPAIPFYLDEANRAGEAGDTVGAAIDTVSAIPMVGMGVRAANAGLDAARPAIRAYHGSPHDFDRFDFSHIGSGEGAQAYGRGGYFAEREGIAKGYRDRLSSGDYGFRSADDVFYETEQMARLAADELGVRLDDEVDRDGWEWAFKNFAEQGQFHDHPGQSKEFHDAYEMARRAIEDAGLQRQAPGSMYEVEINATPDEMLDWDEPLASQSEYVLDRIVSVSAPGLGHDATGKDLYRALAKEYGDGVAAEILRDAGVKGIRYLDAGSRVRDEGLTRNFVVFDDSIVDILRKYGIAGLTAAGGAGGALLAGSDDASADPAGYTTGGRY